jgi:hypothetical protein
VSLAAALYNDVDRVVVPDSYTGEIVKSYTRAVVDETVTATDDECKPYTIFLSWSSFRYLPVYEATARPNRIVVLFCRTSTQMKEITSGVFAAARRTPR